MSRITTDHKGLTISFSENEDKWSCIELNYSNASLAKVKGRIDKYLRDQRKGMSVSCLYLGETYSANTKLTPAEIVEYLPNKKVPSYAKDTGPTVAVMISDGPKDRPTRREKGLACFGFDTPEVIETLRKARTMQDEARRLHREAEGMVKALPRLTLDDISGLVSLAHQMDEEG